MSEVSEASRANRVLVRSEQVADGFALVVSALLPWSTSGTLIALTVWIIALLPTVSMADLRRELMSGTGGLPVVLVALFVIGMLWADADLTERVHALGGIYKLLAIPFLLVQFRRSEEAARVLGVFLVSCTALLLWSWAVVWWPVLMISDPSVPSKSGVPVRDHIVQSGVSRSASSL